VRTEVRLKGAFYHTKIAVQRYSWSWNVSGLSAPKYSRYYV